MVAAAAAFFAAAATVAFGLTPYMTVSMGALEYIRISPMRGGISSEKIGPRRSLRVTQRRVARFATFSNLLSVADRRSWRPGDRPRLPSGWIPTGMRVVVATST